MTPEQAKIKTILEIEVNEREKPEKSITRVNLSKVKQNSNAILILSVKLFDIILLQLVLLSALLFEVVHYVFGIVRCEHAASITPKYKYLVRLHQ